MSFVHLSWVGPILLPTTISSVFVHPRSSRPMIHAVNRFAMCVFMAMVLMVVQFVEIASRHNVWQGTVFRYGKTVRYNKGMKYMGFKPNVV